MSKLTLGIVGTGHIAGDYVTDLKDAPQITLAGVTDKDLEKARVFAKAHNLNVYDSLGAMLADETIDLIVNLTVHHAHYEVNKACLEAGKHVYSEKPLALSYAEAKTLVDLAAAKGLRLGAAPFTLLYETHQSAWRIIRSGELGHVPFGLRRSQLGACGDVAFTPRTLLRCWTSARCRRLSADLFNRRIWFHSRGDQLRYHA